MRGLFYFLTFAVLSSANGQDYCKFIKKEVSPDKKTYDYSSPPDAQEVTTIKITRTINTDPDYESDNFFMVFQVVGQLESIYTKTTNGDQVEKEEYKFIVEFEDKSKITDDTLKIIHDLTNDKSESVRLIYYPLTENTVKDFSTKKITKFSLAGYEKLLPPDSANTIMHYVQCMKNVK